jgi:hypothetical protein
LAIWPLLPFTSVQVQKSTPLVSVTPFFVARSTIV